MRRGAVERLYPNSITTCLDGQALGVTSENVATGQYGTWRGDAVLSAPFAIVADTPGGGLVVPVVSARVAAQAARHLNECCPDIRTTWRVNPQAGSGPVMVWGCARPSAGQPRPELDAHTFLLATGDSLPPVWTAICGYHIPGAQFEALDPGMSRACQGCQQQRWSALHPEPISLPVRLPGAHLHPQLRRPPVAGHYGPGGTST